MYSYMHTFPLKVHYKAIKILVVRWVGTRLLKHIFTETIYYIQVTKAGRSPENDDEVSTFNLTISKYFTGQLGRSESLYL